jgi:tRNA-splicing ligase RtcB
MIHLTPGQVDEMLAGGARWAVDKGFGSKEDLAYIEEQGTIAAADP